MSAMERNHITEAPSKSSLIAAFSGVAWFCS